MLESLIDHPSLELPGAAGFADVLRRRRKGREGRREVTSRSRRSCRATENSLLDQLLATLQTVPLPLEPATLQTAAALKRVATKEEKVQGRQLREAAQPAPL